VKGQGSGVLLPSGKIATNRHVVEGALPTRWAGQKSLSAPLYTRKMRIRTSVSSMQGITGKPAQLGKAVGLKVGDPVYAVGAPQGLELSLSDGIVAQLRADRRP